MNIEIWSSLNWTAQWLWSFLIDLVFFLEQMIPLGRSLHKKASTARGKRDECRIVSVISPRWSRAADFWSGSYQKRWQIHGILTCKEPSNSIIAIAAVFSIFQGLQVLFSWRLIRMMVLIRFRGFHQEFSTNYGCLWGAGARRWMEPWKDFTAFFLWCIFLMGWFSTPQIIDPTISVHVGITFERFHYLFLIWWAIRRQTKQTVGNQCGNSLKLNL